MVPKIGEENRPKTGFGYTSTPRTADMIRLLGKWTNFGPVQLSADEFRAIKRVYGFQPEEGDGGPAQELMQAGADRNALRTAEFDGRRMVAWLAKFCEAGEDPLKVLIRMAMDCGCDVDASDMEWALDEEPQRDEVPDPGAQRESA